MDSIDKKTKSIPLLRDAFSVHATKGTGAKKVKCSFLTRSSLGANTLHKAYNDQAG